MAFFNSTSYNVIACTVNDGYVVSETLMLTKTSLFDFASFNNAFQNHNRFVDEWENEESNEADIPKRWPSVHFNKSVDKACDASELL